MQRSEWPERVTLPTVVAPDAIVPFNEIQSYLDRVKWTIPLVEQERLRSYFLYLGAERSWFSVRCSFTYDPRYGVNLVKLYRRVFDA